MSKEWLTLSSYSLAHNSKGIRESEIISVLQEAKRYNKRVMFGMRHPSSNQDPPFGVIERISTEPGGLVHLNVPGVRIRTFSVKISEIAWVEAEG